MSLPPLPPAPRSPWQKLYGALLARRRRRLARAARRLPVPVVSIGNLHLGGGGKTPMAIAIASRLEGAGWRVAILSRGYRRTSRGPRIVSRGAGPLLDPAAAGDEPHLLARRLPGVAVVVAESRFDGGELALEALDPRPDLLLLDDGFAHVALARDLDLLLVPAADPWAGGRLLPSGRLREPLAAVAAADAALLTGLAEPLAGGEGAELARALSAAGFRGTGFAAATAAGPPRLLEGVELAAGTPVFAAAAIARPESLFALAERLGLRVTGRRGFPDHHDFSESDLRDLEREARAGGAAALLVSEKDVAKIEGRAGLPLAVLPIETRPEPAFWEWLEGRLAELPE